MDRMEKWLLRRRERRGSASLRQSGAPLSPPTRARRDESGRVRGRDRARGGAAKQGWRDVQSGTLEDANGTGWAREGAADWPTAHMPPSAAAPPPGTNNQAIKTGHGPFVAVAATDDNVLAGIAAGWMWGWKDFRLPATDDAFTVGIGLILDDDIKDLADGFDEDKPLPEGETDIRFEEKARVGVVLLFTRSF